MTEQQLITALKARGEMIPLLAKDLRLSETAVVQMLAELYKPRGNETSAWVYLVGGRGSWRTGFPNASFLASQPVQCDDTAGVALAYPIRVLDAIDQTPLSVAYGYSIEEWDDDWDYAGLSIGPEPQPARRIETDF